MVNEIALTDKNYSATLTNYGVKYYWRVSASFTECLSNWSETRNFTTMTGTPTLVLPEDNTTNTQLDVLFDWSDVGKVIAKLLADDFFLIALISV